jgi:hypothetical protein
MSGVKALYQVRQLTRVPGILGWLAILIGLLGGCKEDRIKIVGTVSMRPSLEISLPLANLGSKYVTRENFFIVSGTCSSNTANLEAKIYPADQLIDFIDSDCSNGTWSSMVDAATLTEGDNTFAIHGVASSTTSTTYPVSDSLTINYDTKLDGFARTKPDIFGIDFFTQSETEVISGTCDIDVVDIQTDRGTVLDEDCSDGKWSLAPYTFATEGSWGFSIEATDLAGNTKSIETIIHYDITPPSVAITIPGTSPFRTKELTEISGTCSDVSGIYALWAEITDTQFTRKEYFTCTEMGNWAFTPNMLSYGNNNVVIRARDFAVNSSLLVSVILDFDNLPPHLAITGYPPSKRTNISPFTLSGTCGFVDNDTAVTLQTSKGVFYDANCEDGTWSLVGYDFAAGGDGDYEFTITASDDLLNAISKSVTLTYDQTPPDVTIDQVDAFKTNNATPTFTGTCDTVGEVNLLINDLYPTACTDGLWSYTLPSQTSEGEKLFWIDASDDLGNTLTKNITWTYDITPPVFDFTAPVATSGFFLTANHEVSVSGTCDDQVVSMQLVSDTGRAFNLSCATGTWEMQAPFILEAGTNTITINVTDEAGNTSENKSISVEYDNVPPTMSIEWPSPTGVFSTELASIKIAGLCGREGIALTLFEPSVPGYQFESNACLAEGTWILNSAYPLSLGANTITIKAYDAIGNARPVTIVITRTVPHAGQSLAGHARYSLIPPSETEELVRPGRAILIAALDESGTELNSTLTDANGSFELKVPAGQTVSLVMKAIMPSPFIPGEFLSVTHPDGSSASYEATSLLVPATPVTDIVLSVPLAEGTIPLALAAPFALLDTIYEAHFVSNHVPNNNQIDPESGTAWIIPSPESLADNQDSFDSLFRDTPLVSLGEGSSIPAEASGPWSIHFEVEDSDGPVEKVLEMSLLP